jgi:hypothetical protein
MLKSIFEKQRNIDIWNGVAVGVACELTGNQLVDDAYFGIYERDILINYLGFNENWIFITLFHAQKTTI